MPRARPALLAALALMALLPLAGAAQAPIHGRVVDAGSGAPVLAARVWLASRGGMVITDEYGVFSLPRRALRADTLIVHRLGFDTALVEIAAGTADSLTIRLVPNPVVMAGLQILALDIAGRNGTLCPYDMVRSSAGDFLLTQDPLQLVEDRMGFRPVPCRGSAGEGGSGYCAVLRGMVEPIDLYIDGIGMAGGLAALRGFPSAHVYAIEVLHGGRLVWVTTRQGALRIAGGQMPAPAVPLPR